MVHTKKKFFLKKWSSSLDSLGYILCYIPTSLYCPVSNPAFRMTSSRSLLHLNGSIPDGTSGKEAYDNPGDLRDIG